VVAWLPAAEAAAVPEQRLGGERFQLPQGRRDALGLECRQQPVTQLERRPVELQLAGVDVDSIAVEDAAPVVGDMGRMDAR
jgi:hypothetical protein